MYLQGNFLIFLVGVLSCIWAKPHLQDNGYRDILVYVGHDVPDKDAGTVVGMIQEMLKEASEDMYYANQGRVYIHEVTIVVPNHWTNEMLPELSGATVRGEIYSEADIQIGRMNKETGEAPFTKQIKGVCGAPDYGENGEPILVSLEYLKGLQDKRDEYIVNYGPMGKLIAQEFAKYHHGIYEEYGYPGKQNNEENAEQFPSLYLHSFVDKDGVKKMGAVDNYCADVDLKGDRSNYKLDGDHLVDDQCVIDDETGEILSPSCYFKAYNTGQDAVSSIGSYQYTDMITTFCDGSEYLPHNHEAPSLHNEYCEGASQWETIVSHREFADGNNGPVWIEDTTPTFYTKSQASARFILVIDYSGSMSSNFRMEHLHTSAIRWITQLKQGTQVAIVKFGSSASKVIDWTEAVSGQDALIKAINAITPNGGGTCMACGLSLASEMMLDPSSPGRAGVVMTFTDGQFNEGTDVGDPKVYGPFKHASVRVVIVLMGTKKNTDLETLAGQTKGKVFTVNYDGSTLDDTFSWASQTYIPKDVGDHYEWTISDEGIPGIQAAQCGFKCLHSEMPLDDQTNSHVTVTIRLKEDNASTQIVDFIQMANVTESASGNDDGYDFNVDTHLNQATLKKTNPDAGKFTVDVRFKEKISPRHFAQVKVTGHRSGDNKEPYVVECEYPSAIKNTEKFLITGIVKQGNTVVKGATIAARVSKSMDDDSSGTERSCLMKLVDDGVTQVSGDITKFDGVHAYILDPRTQCGTVDLTQVSRMQVLCTMLSSQDSVVTDNDFFSKRNADTRGLPSYDNELVSPYCCGSSNQTWSSPQKVNNVGRNTYNTAVKNEVNIMAKDLLTADFGPPGRISDLRATRVGDERSGVVKLKWTGAGADPAYGTPAYYDVHYSTERSGLYTKNLKMSSRVSSSMLRSGSLAPVPIGDSMSLTVEIPSLELPGTYHFAVRAVDSHGNEAKSSNIVTVNFHDGSPVVRDVSPLHVHGIPHVDMPLIDKLRKIYPDERMVQGALKRAEKNRQMVWEAENSVMEKRLRKKFGNNEKVMANIINTIKNNPDQRNAYKKILL